jgi:hypothetical protein
MKLASPMSPIKADAYVIFNCGAASKCGTPAEDADAHSQLCKFSLHYVAAMTFSPQLPARRGIRGGKGSAATAAAAEPHGELKAKDMMRRRCFRRLIEYPVNQGRNLVAWTG